MCASVLPNVHALSPVQCRRRYAIELNSVTLATLPPIVLKSHAPTISHGDAVLNLLNSADVRIHTIRNAVDNIVSKFHGNPKAFSERKGTSKGSLWDDLISARKRNQTTAQFDKCVIVLVIRSMILLFFFID